MAPGLRPFVLTRYPSYEPAPQPVDAAGPCPKPRAGGRTGAVAAGTTATGGISSSARSSRSRLSRSLRREGSWPRRPRPCLRPSAEFATGTTGSVGFRTRPSHFRRSYSAGTPPRRRPGGTGLPMASPTPVHSRGGVREGLEPVPERIHPVLRVRRARRQPCCSSPSPDSCLRKTNGTAHRRCDRIRSPPLRFRAALSHRRRGRWSSRRRGCLVGVHVLAGRCPRPPQPEG